MMDKIITTPQYGMILVDGELVTGEVVTELGLMSYFQCNKDNININHIDGYLLRTKVIILFLILSS